MYCCGNKRGQAVRAFSAQRSMIRFMVLHALHVMFRTVHASYLEKEYPLG